MNRAQDKKNLKGPVDWFFTVVAALKQTNKKQLIERDVFPVLFIENPAVVINACLRLSRQGQGQG